MCHIYSFILPVIYITCVISNQLYCPVSMLITNIEPLCTSTLFTQISSPILLAYNYFPVTVIHDAQHLIQKKGDLSNSLF